MSYILDALKKLENEKQKKTSAHGMVSISGELFRDVPRRPSGNNSWKIVVIVLIASLVTCGGTWFLLKSGKGGEKANSSPVVPMPPAIKPAAPAPILPPPITAPLPATPIPVPAAPTPVLPEQKPPVAAAVSTGVTDSTDESSVRRQGKRVKERNAAARSVPLEKTAVISVAAPADIKVTGIAWQDERRARRAVINGFLLQEGGVVSGARITEILQDRIRFSLDGSKVFEVPLALSGFPGAGK